MSGHHSLLDESPETRPSASTGSIISQFMSENGDAMQMNANV